MKRIRTFEEREFGRVRRPFLHPAQTLVLAFAGAIIIGTGLLMLPWSRSGPEPTGFLDALFTATAAVCVTGMSPVDFPTYWSTFGHVVVMSLFQAGGFGIMTMASLLGLLVSRRMGLRTRLTAAAETNTIGIGEVRQVLFGVLKVTVLIELVLAVILSTRFWLAYDESPGRAAYLGVFHAVSSFNSAGFALWSDSLTRFVSDPWVLLPVCVAVILGGIGFPVLFELRREFARPRLWSLHMRMTIWGSLLLLVGGWIFITAVEWNNPGTLGALGAPDRVLNGLVQSVMPRTAGFQTMDYRDMGDTSLLATTVLMFIGGGSASTAGGIKVTTFFLLLFVIIAEVRGEQDVEVGKRRVDPRAQRQALSVALVSVAAVIASSMLLMGLTDLPLSRALFEVTAALSTAGLSVAGTPDLPASAHVLLIVLMFVGRLGPITLVSALALRERAHLYRLPEGRPLIG